MGLKFSKAPPIEERCLRPTGLYPDADVDLKKLRKLILDHKLAPCYQGLDDEPSSDEIIYEDCPICFLFYPSVNRSRCCKKGICTECFLQVKAPLGALTALCPYCKAESYAVEYHGPKSREEYTRDKAEEQRVIELKIKSRKEQDAASNFARMDGAAQHHPHRQSPAPVQHRYQSGEGQQSSRELSRTNSKTKQRRTIREVLKKDRPVQQDWQLPSIAPACATPQPPPAPISGFQLPQNTGHGSRNSTATPSFVLAKEEVALESETNEQMVGQSWSRHVGASPCSIIDDLLSAMGLLDVDHSSSREPRPCGKQGDSDNSEVIDEIISGMFSDRSWISGTQGGIQQAGKGVSGLPCQFSGSSRSATNAEIATFAGYLLSTPRAAQAQFSRQETIVGMVLLQFDKQSSVRCSSSAVVTQPDGSSMVANPMATNMVSTAAPTEGEEVAVEEEMTLLDEAEVTVEERQGICEGRSGDDERIERSVYAGDSITLATINSQDGQLAHALRVSDQLAAWSDLAASAHEERLMTAINNVDACVSQGIGSDDMAIRRAVVHGDHVGQSSADVVATASPSTLGSSGLSDHSASQRIAPLGNEFSESGEASVLGNDEVAPKSDFSTAQLSVDMDIASESRRERVLLDADAAFREKLREQDEALRRFYQESS